MPTTLDAMMASYSCPAFPTHVCVSERLMPRPSDWDENLQIRGPLVLTEDEQLCLTKPPPAELLDFVKTGMPPLYMGWGSMLCKSPEHMAELVIRALFMSKQRAVVLRGWARLSLDLLDSAQPDYAEVRAYAEKNILFVDNVPHAWLFPRCSAIVCHGGSGTAHAALASGRPVIITPVFMDQFSFARYVNEQGAGVGTVQLHKLTDEALAAHILRVLGDGGMVARARQLAACLRQEDGCAAVAAAVEEWFARQGASGAWRKDFDERWLRQLREGMAKEARAQGGLFGACCAPPRSDAPEEAATGR